MKTIILIIGFITCTNIHFMQAQLDCEARLEVAFILFEKGQINLVVDTLSDCTSYQHKKAIPFSNNLNKQTSFRTKLKILELLIEICLYNNDYNKANQYYLQLLHLYPSYQPTFSSTPSPEIISFSQQYHSQVQWSLAFSSNINFSRPIAIQSYALENRYIQKEKYPFTTGGGLNISGAYHFFNSPLTLGVTASTISRNFKYRGFYDNAITPQGDKTTAVLGFKEQQRWWDFGLELQVYLSRNKTSKLLPFATIQGNFHLLQSASFNNVSITFEEFDELWLTNIIPIDKSAHNIDGSPLPSLRKLTNFSIAAGLGLQYRLGRHFVFIQSKSSLFLKKLNNAQNRKTHDRLISPYNYLDNDFQLFSTTLEFGFKYAIYKAKNHKNTFLDISD